MAKDRFVEVELIANPSVTRKMSENSLRLNKNKWREIGSAQVIIQKKKDAEPVANEDTGLPDKPNELELARAAYFTKFGTKPDGRFSITRLNELINNPASRINPE